MDSMSNNSKHGVKQASRNEGGFGFAQLMIVMPIILIIMVSAAQYFYDKLLTNSLIRSRENFVIHQQNMLTDLENPMVWEETLRLSSTINCMADASCTSVAASDITIIGVDGKNLSGSNSRGYRIDGTACKAPKAGETAEDCPIKWYFKWRPMCSNVSACPSTTDIEFTGELKESGLIGSRLNLNRYKIILYRRLF